MKTLNGFAALSIALAMNACSSEDTAVGEASDNHVWEEQVEAIDEAKAVEDTLKAAADLHKQAIEAQTE